MIHTARMVLFVLLFAAPASAQAQGMGGDPKDRLDWPGSATDRYLSSGEVRDRLHEASEGLFGCFREALRSKPEGGASVTFVIDREGRGKDIIVDPGKAPESLMPCVQSVIGGVEFGAHDGDPMEVSYPLVYEVDTKGARLLPYPIVFTRPRPVRLPLFSLPLDVSPGELKMLELIFTQDPPEGEEPPASPTEGDDEAHPHETDEAGE